jgi:hypothetical protein
MLTVPTVTLGYYDAPGAAATLKYALFALHPAHTQACFCCIVLMLLTRALSADVQCPCAAIAIGTHLQRHQSQSHLDGAGAFSFVCCTTGTQSRMMQCSCVYCTFCDVSSVADPTLFIAQRPQRDAHGVLAEDIHHWLATPILLMSCCAFSPTSLKKNATKTKRTCAPCPAHARWGPDPCLPPCCRYLGVALPAAARPHVTICFCSLQPGSTDHLLTGNVDALLGTFSNVVRVTLQACGGYECQEKQGVFMLAFCTTREAMEWGLTLQLALMEVRC